MKYTKEDLDGMTFYHEDDLIKKDSLYKIKFVNDEPIICWTHPDKGSTCNYGISNILDNLKTGVWVAASKVNKELPIFN